MSSTASKRPADEGNNYFKIAVKPQLSNMMMTNAGGGSSEKNSAQARQSPNRAGVDVDLLVPINPILSYDPVESPSANSCNQAGAGGGASASNAPFAQKVADMISKKQEPAVEDDVYGLEQSAISAVSAAQPLTAPGKPSVSIMSSLVNSPNLKILTNSNEKNSARFTT